MTTASTHCFNASRCGLLRALLRAGGVVLGIALALPAAAHKASDAYLLLDARGPGATLRVDLALRDLDAALDIDTDGDAKLTWAEVRAALPTIETYALQRIDVAGCAATPRARALERRADGAYAALTFALNCNLSAAPQVRYRVLREIDPTHRGLLRVQLPGQAPLLRVLDPTLDLPEAPTGRIAVTTGSHSAVLPSAANDEVATEGQTQGAQASLSNAVQPSPSANANLAAEDVASAAPRTKQSTSASAGFVGEGVHHIVTGWDHVLFLLCLLLPSVMVRTRDGWRPVERLGNAVWPVAGIVTAFTLAHSITLTLAALKIVSLSPSFIEPAIAATIVLAAVDNVRPIFFGHRGWVTFAFGLIHGFGFAGVLAELELPAAQFAWALFQFNLGLELGQLAIVVLATGLLFALRGRSGYTAWAIRGGSFAAMAIGVLWLIERIGDVSLLPF
jgi:HupE / UreJ protein